MKLQFTQLFGEDPPTKKKIPKDYSKNPYYKGREDWGEKLDYKFPNGKKPVRDLITSAAKQMGVDPGLLYTSSMEEGMKLALQGEDTGVRRTGYKELIAKNPKAAKEYPVDGGYFYGLNTFGDKYGKIIKPSSFPSGYKFQPYPQTNPETGEVFYNSAAFKSHDDAIMAKAGMMRQVEDAMQARYKKNNINLDPEAQKFFSMVGYNMGEDKTIEMIKSFEKKGYLKDNKFLDPNFKPASWQEPYTNVQRRYQNYKILSDEGHFNPDVESIETTQNTNMKNKTSKFAFGGTAMNIDSPSQDLEQIKRTTEEAMIGSMYDPAVMGLKGLGNTMTSAGFGMAMQGIDQMGGIGNFLGQARESLGGRPSWGNVHFGAGADVTRAALGGVMGQNIEAEGKEVIETPGGSPMELKGPSHENGGINMVVPTGTEVYSKRVTGDDGKTMAERKKTREKQLMKITKLFEKNPNDKALKKTLQRIQTNNEVLDKKDLSQMEFIKNMLEGPSQPQGEKFALGGMAGIDPITGLPLHDDLIDKYNIPKTPFDFIMPLLNDPLTANIVDRSDYNEPSPTTGISNASSISNPTTTATNQQPKENFMGNLLGGLTGGDILGMAGNLYGAFGGLQNTMNQRNATNPEVNHFKDFGQKALDTIKGQYGFIDDLRSSQLQDVELARQGTINRNNNSTRSINTQRALNLVTDSQTNEAKSQVQNQFAQQMMGIMGQQAGQENTMDQAKMTGEMQRADNEVKNQDSFYSNLARNIASIGTATALTGKSMNDMKERDTMMKIVENANPNFYIDSSGVIRSRVTNAVVTLAQVKAYEGKSKEKKEDKE